MSCSELDVWLASLDYFSSNIPCLTIEREVRIVGTRWLCTNGWDRSRNPASQQRGSLVSEPLRHQPVWHSATQPQSGLRTGEMGIKRANLDITLPVHLELMRAITSCLNKTSRKQVMWGFGVCLRCSLMAFSVTCFPSRLWFQFLWPQLTTHILLMREAVGTGCECGGCCALVCTCTSPLQPQRWKSGLGWCCGGVTEELLPCYSCSWWRGGGTPA